MLRDIRGQITYRSEDELAEAVQRGVRLLNEKVPTWRDAFRDFSPEQFNMGSVDFCVLGQLSNAIMDKTLRLEIPRDIQAGAVYQQSKQAIARNRRPSWHLGLELLSFTPYNAMIAAYYGFDHYPSEPGWGDGNNVNPNLRKGAYCILQSLWIREIWGE